MSPIVGVQKRIEQSGAETVGVAFHCPETSEEWQIHPDTEFHAASTMKVGVLIELFRQAELGLVRLDDRLTIRNEFASLLDGSPFCVTEEDDADPSFFRRIGEEETLLNLAVPMITLSSNFATNLLVARLGADQINATMVRIGAEGLKVRRGVEDGKAFQAGLNNTATARALMTLAAGMLRREIVSPAASEAMIDILLQQIHRNCLPAKLPPGARVAHKTGWNSGICHDFGIVFPETGSPYALAVLTKGLDEYTSGPELIADISSIIYHARFS